MFLRILLISFILFAGSLCLAEEYFINANRGSNDYSGTSAEEPWKTISYALSQVVGSQEIQVVFNVANGTYNMELGESFPIVISRLSVELKGEDPDKTMIDADGSGESVFKIENANGTNIENVSINGGEGLKDLIDGEKYGGGIYLKSDNITVKGCVIKGNSADYGGGIWLYESDSVYIENCDISSNSSTISGGGIHSIFSTIIYDSCTINYNRSYNGAGIFSDRDDSVKINDCTFDLNFVENSGIAEENTGGAAIYSNDALLNIDGSRFIDNCSSQNGGAIIFKGSLSSAIKNCLFDANHKDPKSPLSGVGGAIFCKDSSNPEISDCYFVDNNATSGGCIYCTYDSSPVIYNCYFKNNLADVGGAISIFYHSNPNIKSCIFEENKATNGAGIYCADNTEPEITGCYFVRNTATGPEEQPQTVNLESINYDAFDGGGIFIYSSNPIIRDCEFIQNKAGNDGGGIFCDGDSYPFIDNSLFVENVAENSYNSEGVLKAFTYNAGGGIFSKIYAEPWINNCTFVGNSSAIAVYYNTENDKGNATVTNCIIVENQENIILPIDIAYSMVQEGYDGPGNIDGEPFFVVGPQGDFYLSSESPCVDKGSDFVKNIDMNRGTTRIDGIIDFDRVDMGYHYQPHIQFELDILTDRKILKAGDQFSLSLKVKTASVRNTVDLYFLLINPPGDEYSGLTWSKGKNPAAFGLIIPPDFNLDLENLLTFSIPSEFPDIEMPGTYKFVIYATLTGTDKFISNIDSEGFIVW